MEAEQYMYEEVEVEEEEEPEEEVEGQKNIIDKLLDDCKVARLLTPSAIFSLFLIIASAFPPDRAREEQLQVEVDEYTRSNRGKIHHPGKMPHGTVKMFKKKAMRLSEEAKGRDKSLWRQNMLDSNMAAHFVMILLDPDADSKGWFLTCKEATPPPELVHIKELGQKHGFNGDIATGFKIAMPPHKEPKTDPGQFFCLGCGEAKDEISKAGKITIPRFAMYDPAHWGPADVCSDCMLVAKQNKVKGNAVDANHRLFGSMPISEKPTAKSEPAPPSSPTAGAAKSGMGKMWSMGVKATKLAAKTAAAGAEMAAEASGSSTAKSMVATAESVVSSAAATAQEAASRAMESSPDYFTRWKTQFNIEPNSTNRSGNCDYHKHGMTALDSIEYVSNSKMASDDGFHGIEVVIFDEKSTFRTWTIKFEDDASANGATKEEKKMIFASALLAAKKAYRPMGERNREHGGLLTKFFDKSKEKAKDQMFNIMAAAFQKAFDWAGSKSPWLKCVAQAQDVNEIKAFVREQIKNGTIPHAGYLAKRCKWALNITGHNALHYACWFGKPLSILRYLTDPVDERDHNQEHSGIGINVNDKGTFGTGVHQALFKGNLEICQFLVFKSHNSRHAPRISILEETMRAGVMLLEEWTPSDLVNNMWLFNYVGFKITQEDLGVVTSFLDYEIEELECWRDAFAANKGTDKFSKAAEDKLNQLLRITSDTQRKIDEISDKIDSLSSQLAATKDTLLRGILDANELTVPNCFVIVPDEIEEYSKEEESILAKIDLENLPDDPAAMVKKAGAGVKDMTSKLKKAKKMFRWMGQCVDMATSDSASLIKKAKEMTKGISEKYLESTFYLYLVDEIVRTYILLFQPDALRSSSWPLPPGKLTSGGKDI
jgi:hypothetical protein